MARKNNAGVATMPEPTLESAPVEETPEKKERKKRTPKAEVPAFDIPDGGLLAPMPDGYEFKKFKPLSKKQFAQEHVFFSHRAIWFDVQAERFRHQAIESERCGSGKERKKAKRLCRMQEKMAELRKELEEQGIDVNELLNH